MLFSTVNMYLVLSYMFHDTSKLPKILSFWVYTLAGLGVFVIFQYIKEQEKRSGALPLENNGAAVPDGEAISHLDCMVNGVREQIPLADILYVESLENYIKVVTIKKNFLVRLSMKEAEERLPRPTFLRISRSHIVHTIYSAITDGDIVKVHDRTLKIGKVYKRYVEEARLQRA